MTRIIREYGLAINASSGALRKAIGCARAEESGDRWKLINNDSVLECQNMESDSVHLIMTSIPFSTQYEYSPSYLDFGHSDNNDHFWAQMDYLTKELFRVLKPGRIAAIHVKDRICPGGVSGLGFQTVQPFSDECQIHMRKHGFAFLARKTIVTDVVRENAQTYRLGWTEQCKDGSRMGNGMPEYLMVFRKPPSDLSNGYADDPVIKSKDEYTRAKWQLDASGFSRSDGNRLLTKEDLKGLRKRDIYRAWKKLNLAGIYSFEDHVELCENLDEIGMLPTSFQLVPPHSWHEDVWTDIARMRTLNMVQQRKGKEFHLCPMQFDIADRAIEQYTMAGEVVFDPFAGIGSVPLRAYQLGRYGLGCELNPGYWMDGCYHLRQAENHKPNASLFDLDEIEVSEDDDIPIDLDIDEVVLD